MFPLISDLILLPSLGLLRCARQKSFIVVKCYSTQCLTVRIFNVSWSMISPIKSKCFMCSIKLSTTCTCARTVELHVKWVMSISLLSEKAFGPSKTGDLTRDFLNLLYHVMWLWISSINIWVAFKFMSFFHYLQQIMSCVVPEIVFGCWKLDHGSGVIKFTQQLKKRVGYLLCPG